uniref:SEA domain-containing protein n=1 Tax=Steinernema glaseri TaxID=37863 RepID=A0A1I7Z2E1_9BILA
MVIDIYTFKQDGTAYVEASLMEAGKEIFTFRKKVYFSRQRPVNLAKVIREIYQKDTRWHEQSCYVTAEICERRNKFFAISGNYQDVHLTNEATYRLLFHRKDFMKTCSLSVYSMPVESSTTDRSNSAYSDEISFVRYSIVPVPHVDRDWDDLLNGRKPLDFVCPLRCPDAPGDWTCTTCGGKVCPQGDNLACDCGLFTWEAASFRCGHKDHEGRFVKYTGEDVA